MDLKYIKIGDYVHVDKPSSVYDREEGEVLSIYLDYGTDSDIVSIRLLLEDGSVIGGFKAEEIMP